MLLEALVDDSSCLPIARGAEWVWGSGFCGHTPWWLLASQPAVITHSSADDAPHAASMRVSGSSDVKHSDRDAPTSLPHGHSAAPAVASKSAGKSSVQSSAATANVAALLETTFGGGGEGLMVDPLVADMLHRTRRQGAGPEPESRHSKVIEGASGLITTDGGHTSSAPPTTTSTARRNLRSAFGGSGPGSAPGGGNSPNDGTSAGSRGGDSLSTAGSGVGAVAGGDRVLPAVGELVFVPELDDGPSFLTPQLDVEKSRSGMTWRWRTTDVLTAGDDAVSGKGADDCAEATERGRANSRPMEQRPILQVISRGAAVTTGDVRCLAVASGHEQIFACGGQGGRITMWGLDAVEDRKPSARSNSQGGLGLHTELNPWSSLSAVIATPHHYISSLHFRGGGQHVAALGDGLSLWDVVTQKCVLSYDVAASSLVAMSPSRLSSCSWDWGVHPSPAYSHAPSEDNSVMFVASHSSIACLDFRVRHGMAAVVAEFKQGLGAVRRPGPVSKHGASAAPDSAFGALQCIASDRYEVYAGSSTGSGACLSRCALLCTRRECGLHKCVCARRDSYNEGDGNDQDVNEPFGAVAVAVGFCVCRAVVDAAWIWLDTVDVVPF